MTSPDVTEQWVAINSCVDLEKTPIQVFNILNETENMP
jgi:hypothetical protein